MLRYVLAWLPMLAIAVANGALRQVAFAKVLPELRAHQLSTLTGAVLIGAFIWFLIGVWPPATERQAWQIGLVWLGLTVAFETFMGLVLSHRSLAQVLHDYDLRAGRLWSLFLVWLTVAPWVCYHLHRAA